MAASTAILPPVLPWDGTSRSLALDPDSDDPWITPAEESGLKRTPSYDETTAWLERLAAAAPEVEMVSLGKSVEGRDLWMVIVSDGGHFTPQAMAAGGKPVVLAQAGIHSGEIDGKDAGLMLLRELTVGGSRRQLLDRVELLFVPIFNVDGHERVTEFGRVNQRGPERMGWRTTARNLNLNRDYAKAETPEMRAMITALDVWRPDLYVDHHVTDGMDFQYDITWGACGTQSHSPASSGWLEGVLDPAVRQRLEEMGHVPGGLIFAIDGNRPDDGIYHWTASDPRFSDGYGCVRHLPTILVENHSLKPYDQRVLGTYVFLAAVLEAVGEGAGDLSRAIDLDRARRPARLPLAWTVPRDQVPASRELLAVAWRHEDSAVSGGQKVVWLGEPETRTLPVVTPSQPLVEVTRPATYWVPGAWSEVIERLAVHGIGMEILTGPREVEVEMYRVSAAKIADRPFEGRVRVEPGDSPTVERRRERYPAGSARVPTDQPLGGSGDAPARASVAGLLLPVGVLPRDPESHRIRRGLRHGADGRAHAGGGPGAQGGVREEARGRRRVRRLPPGAAAVVLPPHSLLRPALAALPGGAGDRRVTGCRRRRRACRWRGLLKLGDPFGDLGNLGDPAFEVLGILTDLGNFRDSWGFRRPQS